MALYVFIWKESLAVGLNPFWGFHMNPTTCIANLGPTFAYMQIISGVWLLHDVVLSAVDIFLNWYTLFRRAKKKETWVVGLCVFNLDFSLQDIHSPTDCRHNDL